MFIADSSIVTTSAHQLPRYLRGRSRDVYLRAYRSRRDAEAMHIDGASVIQQLSA